MKGESFYDDSSGALDLNHAQHGGKLDSKGRPIGNLGKPDDGYRPDLDGLTPDEIIAKMDARHERPRAYTEDLMRPGYTFQRGKSATASKRKSKKVKPERGTIRPEGDDGLRPMLAAGRVSEKAYEALHAQEKSVGEIMEQVGKLLVAGVPIELIEYHIRALTEDAEAS